MGGSEGCHSDEDCWRRRQYLQGREQGYVQLYLPIRPVAVRSFHFRQYDQAESCRIRDLYGEPQRAMRAREREDTAESDSERAGGQTE